MPSVTFDLTRAIATLVNVPEGSTYNAIGWKGETGSLTPYPATYKARRMTIITSARGTAATFNMPAGAAQVSIDGGADFTLASGAAAVLFTGLPDTFHTIRIVTDFSEATLPDTGNFTVTGSNPAMQYAPNRGKFHSWNYLPHRVPFAFESQPRNDVSQDSTAQKNFELPTPDQPTFTPQVGGFGKIRFSVTVPNGGSGSVYIGVTAGGSFRTKIDNTIQAGFTVPAFTPQGAFSPDFIRIADNLTPGTHSIQLLQKDFALQGLMAVGCTVVEQAPTPFPKGEFINDSEGVLSEAPGTPPGTEAQEPLLAWEQEAGFLFDLWISSRSESGMSWIQNDASAYQPDTHSAVARAAVMGANAALNPAFVFCGRGANDFNRNVDGVVMTRQQFQDGVTDFIYFWRNKTVLPWIILSQIPNSFQEQYRATYYGANETQTFNAAIAEIAAGNSGKGRAANPALAAKCVIISSTPWFQDVDHSNDGVHSVSGPTGNGLIAGHYAPAIATVLGIGPVDTTAPILTSATVDAAGTLLTLAFVESDSLPLLPANGATGFTLLGHTLANGTRIAPATFTYQITGTVYSDEVLTASYPSGNITDSAAAPNALGAIVARVVVNNSAQVRPVVATPTFDPIAGVSETAVNVSVACATVGALLYYTTNGSIPTTSSTPVTGPIHIATTKTLKVLSVKAGMTNSAIASATYTITPPTPTGGVVLQQIFLLPEYPQSATLEPLRLTAGNTAGGLSIWIQIEGIGVVLTGQEVALFSMRERGEDTSIINDQEAVIGPMEANGKRRVTFLFSDVIPVPDAGEYEATWTVAGLTYPFGKRQLVSVKEPI